MICGMNLNRAIQPHRVAGGEMFGGFVAENELIQATLLADADVRWDIWAAGMQSSLSTAPQRSHPDLSYFAARFGARIRARRYPALRETVTGQDYVFVTALPNLPRIHELRHQTGVPSLPICGILHSAIGNDVAQTYTSLAMAASGHDVLVATSRAGLIALEALMEAARERIAFFAGSAPRAKPPRIVQIPLGVTVPPRQSLDRDGARQVLQIPRGCFCILYLGRISEEYKADLEPLFRAVSRLASRHEDVRLILSGQPQHAAYAGVVQGRLARLGLARITLTIESFPAFMKTSILAASDVFVSPVDSIQETFGISVLEAMAHGKPVIASDWSGYRDLVVHGETGFLLPTIWSGASAEAASRLAGTSDLYGTSHYLAQRTIVDGGELEERLETLRKDPTLVRQMGELGRRRVEERFCWERVAPRFVDLWHEQVELGRHAQPQRPFVDFHRFFGHYATETLSPDHLLLPAFDKDGAVPVESWTFYDQLQLEQVEGIVETSSQGPIRIGDLLDRGFSLDCVLWLAKKGFCRISAPASPEKSNGQPCSDVDLPSLAPL